MSAEPELPTAASVPGRAVITSRAYENLVRAVASSALGVPPRRSTVRVADGGGRLDIQISGSISGEGMPVLERIDRTRTTVAEQTTALTGATVGTVAVHITDIRFDERRAR
jgi:hypothetical protein